MRMKKEIPAIREKYCDLCGVKCERKNASRHGFMKLMRDHVDGCANNEEYDLCNGCLESMEGFMRERRKEKGYGASGCF